jgi:predicted nucleic acid-binding protein
LTAYILGVSVAAKWVLPSRDEPLHAESLRLLNGFAEGTIKLSVPDLFWPEAANILWKSVRIGRIAEPAPDRRL